MTKYQLLVGANRLLVLADFLTSPKVPDERFRLEGWGDFNFSKKDCGTAACACRWAAEIPSFKKAGYRFEYTRPTFKGVDAWEAIRLFFAVSQKTAERLFHGSAYISENPKKGEVAARIRAYAKSEIRRLSKAAA